MKKLFALGAAAVLAFGLASCGEEGQEINLVYSGTESDKVFNEGLLEEFKAQMAKDGDPNTYNISYVGHGPDKVDSEILDWAEKGKAPDVYEFASDKIAGLYSKGALARVTGANAKFIDDEMNAFGQACATFGDSYYAYPYTGDNTYYLQYDKSIISAEDAKDMKKLMDVAHSKGYKVGYNLGTGFWGAAAMFTFGADYSIEFTEDGTISDIKADFNGPKGLKAAKAILEIVNHPAFEDTSGVPATGAKIAAVIGGTWDIYTYNPEKDEHGGFKTLWGDNYACAVMPTVTVDGETKNLGAFLGGKLLGINPQVSQGNPAQLQAAHKLARFLSGEYCQLQRFEKNNVAPCHLKAAQNEKVLASPNVAVLSAQGAFAHAQTSVPEGVWSAPSVLITAMKEGKCTAENLQTWIDEYNATVTAK